MKKFRKIILAVSGILASLGIVLILVGALMGGVNTVADDLKSNRLAIDFSGIVIDNESFENMTNIYENGEENRFSRTDVKHLVLNGNAGEYEITVWDESDYCVQGIKGSKYIKYSLEDGTLTVASDEKHLFMWDNPVKVKIYIPKDTVMENAELNVGAGELVCNNIQTEALEVNIGAGEGVFHDIIASNAKFNVGAGECEINNTSFTECQLKVGIGDLSFDGNILGNTDIDCGVGTVELELTNVYEDFNYTVKVGAGDVEIGKEEYSGLSNMINLDNGSDKLMSIDCGMGDVSVEFGNE